MPSDLNDPIFQQAMKVLEEFANKREEFLYYRAREDYARDVKTRESLLSRSQAAEKRAETKAKQAETKAKQAEAESERLKAKLLAAGIDPDE